MKIINLGKISRWHMNRLMFDELPRVMYQEKNIKLFTILFLLISMHKIKSNTNTSKTSPEYMYLPTIQDLDLTYLPLNGVTLFYGQT